MFKPNESECITSSSECDYLHDPPSDGRTPRREAEGRTWKHPWGPALMLGDEVWPTVCVPGVPWGSCQVETGNSWKFAGSEVLKPGKNRPRSKTHEAGMSTYFCPHGAASLDFSVFIFVPLLSSVCILCAVHIQDLHVWRKFYQLHLFSFCHWFISFSFFNYCSAKSKTTSSFRLGFLLIVEHFAEDLIIRPLTAEATRYVGSVFVSLFLAEWKHKRLPLLRSVCVLLQRDRGPRCRLLVALQYIKALQLSISAPLSCLRAGGGRYTLAES